MGEVQSLWCESLQAQNEDALLSCDKTGGRRMKKWKYAIKTGERIRLTNYLDHAPFRDDVIENPKLKITKGILYLSGDLRDYEFDSGIWKGGWHFVGLKKVKVVMNQFQIVEVEELKSKRIKRVTKE